jgi:hypothetical protein
MNEFLQAIAKAYWQMDYADFLFRTGFTESQYSMDKFKDFQHLCRLIGKFDPDTLQSILTLSLVNDGKSEEINRNS